MKRILLCCLFLLLAAPLSAQDIPTVAPTAETAPSLESGATDVAIWVHPEDPALSLILGADDDGGLQVFALDGSELQALEADGGVVSVDLRYNFSFGDNDLPLLAAAIADEPLIVLYTVNAQTRTLERLTTIETGIPSAAMCMYQSLVTNATFVFAVAEDGAVEQYRVQADASGQISTELARAFNVGGELESCAADDEFAAVYFAEGEVAVWRYGAEPESGTNRQPVDFVGGNITDEVEGIAVIYGADGAGYVIIANEKNNSFLLYTRSDNAFVGEFRVAGSATVDDVTEPTSMDATNLALGDAYPLGLFVTSDDGNSSEGGRRENNNYKLVSWGDVAAALGLPLDTEYRPGMSSIAAVGVVASAETAPVPSGTDAADDPAVWIHPTDPALSTIIGTDKTAGLVVYNLDGSIHQTLNIGEVNNVDLRYNFPLGGERVAVVAATNRSSNTLALYTVNAETRELEEAASAPVVSNTPEVYGFCMYYSMVTSDYYAIITATDGTVEQYRLADDGAGRISAAVVRTLSVGSLPEGCVADDWLGLLYVGEERVGIWRFNAEPDASTEPLAQVDSTGPGGNLTADVEGLAIYYTSDGGGYLIASSQGSSEYVVYARTGDNAFIGKFIVAEGTGIDGASGTDGIDVTNFPLGAAFPEGLFVAQDDLNIAPDENQNFKLVSWGAIAQALGLTIDTTYDPRTVGAP